MASKGQLAVIRGEEPQDSDPDQPVFIPPGTYEASLIKWSTDYSHFFKKHILRMNFLITQEGAHYGTLIPGWFNVEFSKSKTTVKAGWRSDILRMYQGCFKLKLKRRDRIPIDHFKAHRLQVEVISVGRDSKGEELGKINQYSRVKRILKILE